MLRKIVKIDPNKCNGCGECVPSCAEGAISIINGKAVLAVEKLCDGLGACLGECPLDAISIEEREADDFDETEVEKNLSARRNALASHNHDSLQLASPQDNQSTGSCPGSQTLVFHHTESEFSSQTVSKQSQLNQWPVQLRLVSTTAPFFQGADLLIAADCVPVAYAWFHEDFLKNKAIVMGCPKLDDNQYNIQKLTELFSKSDVNSITVLKMEVPCCGGIAVSARQALLASGKQIPYSEITIGIQGVIKE